MERDHHRSNEATRQRLEENVPNQLKAEPNWVLWGYEGKPGEKPKKPPFTIDGRRASVSNPETWTTFPQALSAYTQHERYEGLGFMLTGGLTVVDLDHCLDRNGQLTPQAQWIVQAANSYSEISPSGEGLHIFLIGEVPGTARRRENKEMYDEARYITVTGIRLPNTPVQIRESQDAINRIHRQFIQPPDVTKSPARPLYSSSYRSDHQVLEKALRAKNGAKFSQLWEGDRNGYQSASEAHIATVAMLAYWTNGDPVQMDRLFRRSGQFDEATAQKWDKRHSASGKTYGQITIEKALATKQNYTRRDST
jgi:putative DNA primase/helicase